MDNIKTMRILDLFAGTGAFSLAFHSLSNDKVKYRTVMANDYEKASNRAKQTLSFYIAVGEIYREFLHSSGYSKETESIFNEYKKTGLKNLHEFVTEKMLDDLCIAGTPDMGLKKLNAFREIGIDLPIIQFNPIGDTRESFELLTKTFSGETNE